MVARDLRFDLLCEDLATYNFVRRWLQTEGVTARLPPFAGPAGRGAGEQFVRLNYPKRMQEYRRKANFQRVALLVVVDADDATVTHRRQQLDDVLGRDDVRREDERVAVFVPRRNIETWLRALCGDTVDEETDYKRLPGTRSRDWALVRHAADAFASFLRRSPSASDLPSLHVSRTEAAKLA